MINESEEKICENQNSELEWNIENYLKKHLTIELNFKNVSNSKSLYVAINLDNKEIASDYIDF